MILQLEEGRSCLGVKTKTMNIWALDGPNEWRWQSFVDCVRQNNCRQGANLMIVEEWELAEEGMREILICQGGNPKLNIMKVTPAEILLLGFFHSYASYLFFKRS